jgi:hypothetical protein
VLESPSSRGFRNGVGQPASLSVRRDDLYETPPMATRALMRVESLPHRIWEPAAGRGAIVNVLRAAGHEVLASDLVDYGVDPTHFARRDFLLEWKTPDGCEMILTNPPYKLADEFVGHALDLCPRVIMLLRFLFLEGAGRSRILEQRGLARVHLFRERLTMHRDSWDGNKVSGGIAFAWFVWDRTHSGSPTVNRISWAAS